MTRIVDLTRDKQGENRARLLDLVPGRTGKVYMYSLDERGDVFRTNVDIAALDPLAGYKSAINEWLANPTTVLDAIDLAKLGTRVVDEARHRFQQELLGNRGRDGDPRMGIQTILWAGEESLTEK